MGRTHQSEPSTPDPRPRLTAATLSPYPQPYTIRMTGALSGPPSDAPPPRSTAAGANGGRTRAFDTAKGLLLEGLLEG